MTPNHRYSTPTEGSVDWHVPLNDNFRRIDGDVEIRDIEENFDQYSPDAGAKFLATDTGVRYIGDGSQWTELPIQNATRLVAQGVTTDPNTPTQGQLWYRTDRDELRVKIGNSVETLAVGGEAKNDSATPLVESSLDTRSDIDGFWDNVKSRYHSEKVEAVTNPAHEGDGAMRVNFPGGDFYGTEQYHYLDDEELTECHIRYYAMLDEDFEIDNPWGGQQMGKAFPGFDGRFGNDLSNEGGANGTNGWLVNGAVWSADERGGDPDDWYLAQYVYHADQGSDTGDTFWPTKPMKRGRWYQIDRYVKLNSGKNTSDGVLRQWQDGELVFDKTDFNFAWQSPYDKLYAIRNLWYYGGGWGAPSGSGNNYGYLDHIQVFDSEQPPQ